MYCATNHVRCRTSSDFFENFWALISAVVNGENCDLLGPFVADPERLWRNFVLTPRRSDPATVFNVPTRLTRLASARGHSRFITPCFDTFSAFRISARVKPPLC